MMVPYPQLHRLMLPDGEHDSIPGPRGRALEHGSGDRQVYELRSPHACVLLSAHGRSPE
jgi:hypothetical protein